MSEGKTLTEAVLLQATQHATIADVTKVNLFGQKLSDVSILARCPKLRVVSLSVNALQSVAVFAKCARLQELYLRKNKLANILEVAQLKACPELKILWLRDNPLAEEPLYRQFVIRMLPNLQQLDNTTVTAAERLEAINSTNSALVHLEQAALSRNKSSSADAAVAAAKPSAAGTTAAPAAAPAKSERVDARPAGTSGTSVSSARAEPDTEQGKPSPALQAIRVLLPTLSTAELAALHRSIGMLI